MKAPGNNRRNININEDIMQNYIISIIYFNL